MTPTLVADLLAAARDLRTTEPTPARKEFAVTHVCDACSDAAIGALGTCAQEPSDGRDCENCTELARDESAA